MKLLNKDILKAWVMFLFTTANGFRLWVQICFSIMVLMLIFLSVPLNGWIISFASFFVVIIVGYIIQSYKGGMKEKDKDST